MNNTQLAIIIMMFIVTAVGSFSVGKQAGRRELAKMIAETLAKGVQEVSEAFKKYADSVERMSDEDRR